MERAAYILLAVFFLGWLGVTIFGLVEAWPIGIFGFFLLGSIGLLLVKALRDRLRNPEDQHYSRDVDL